MPEDPLHPTRDGSVRFRRRLGGAGIVALVLFAAGCGGGTAGGVVAGDIPDSQVFVPYAPVSGGFTVNVPEGWARTDTGGVVTFTDRFNSVRLESVAAPTAPTAQSAERDDVASLRAASVNFQPGQVTAVTPAGGPALLLTYQVDGPPDPVTSKVARLDVRRYEFWKDGRELILTLSGAVGSDNVDPWRAVADSFRWT